MRHAARIRMMIMYALRAVPDAVSRTRLCREVCRFRTGGAPSAKAVHGLCGGCHPRPAGRTSWMHHGVCVGVCGFRRRLRSASACGFVQHSRRRAALLRCGAVRVHAPRLRVSHGPRGPAALLPRSGPRSALRASGRSVLSPSEKCPTRCAGRAVRGARRCGSVQSRPAPPTRSTSRRASFPTGTARQAVGRRMRIVPMYSTGNRTPLSARNTQSRMAPIMPHGPRSRLRPILHASKWARFQTWTIRTVM